MMEVQHDIAILEQDHLDHYWPHIARALEQCSEVWEDSYTIDGLHTEAIEKRAQVWAAGTPKQWDMIVFTRVVDRMKGRRLEIFLAVGRKFDDYKALLDGTLERFAVMSKCDEVSIIGRRGWVGKLKADGFREETMVAVRPVRGHLNG